MKHVNTMLHRAFKRTLLTLTMIGCSNLSLAQQDLTVIWQNDQFEQPESVIADAKKRVIYVSNINGNPMDKDGNGYISLLKNDGTTITQKWVTGLDAPKGLAQYKNILYVADLARLVAIDVNTAKIIHVYDAPAAKMLNDIAIRPDGVVYVSDFVGGGIYQLKNGKFEQWLNTTPEMSHPNGLLWLNQTLYAATWGMEMQADFSSKTLGSLYTINATTQLVTQQKGAAAFGNLDGLTTCNGTLFTNDWRNGKLFRYNHRNSQAVELMATTKMGLADISCTGKTLYAPMMSDNKVIAYTIPTAPLVVGTQK